MAVCESNLSDRELKVKNLERYLDASEAEHTTLKEELSHYLNLLQSHKESNKKLTQELRLSKVSKIFIKKIKLVLD